MPERPKTEPGLTRGPVSEEPSRVSRRILGWLKHAVDRLVGNDRLTGVMFVLCVALLVTLQQGRGAALRLEAGQAAPQEIRAPFAISVPDAQATELRRQEARAAVLPVFQPDDQALARGHDSLARLFGAGRGALAARRTHGRRALTSGERETLRRAASLAVDDRALDLLVAAEFSETLERALGAALAAVAAAPIASDPGPLLGATGIAIRDRQGTERQESDLGRILDLEEARQALVPALRAASPALDASQAEALEAVLAPLLLPNLIHDAEETARRRAAAADEVVPLVVPVAKGEVIVRRGAVVTPAQADLLRKVADMRGPLPLLSSLAGNLLMLGLLVVFLHRYLEPLQREVRGADHLFGMHMVVGAGMALLTAALIRLATILASHAEGDLANPESYLRAIPVAAGTMAIMLLARARAAMVFGVFGAVVFGMLAGWDLRMTAYALVSNCAAIYSVRQYKQRTAVLKAGAVVGVVNALAALALAAGPGVPPPTARLLLEVALALAGGMLVALTVSTALPVLEWVFNVLTDIRLLELSNLNNPLLRRLAVQAPGTYNHSVIVGTLAEAAAQAVGGNSLLCRVAAYYHDIGKMNKPEYFIENQMNATGLHDKLSPTMSSLVIASHVKDGVRMARDFNLPQPIIDLIPQHHGTRLITYFFNKAKTLANPEIQEVSESNFRYPGPKPQSKEGAIFMMADSVEAAARTIDDPTPAKFQDMIRKILNAVILDDQLTETDLTFSDLDRIQDSFQRTLTSLYHHRIDYPGFEFGDRPTRDRITLPG
jgi:putative nucleotidyltransferase with HDIG domain